MTTYRDEFNQVEKQAFFHVFIQQLVGNGDQQVFIVTMKKDVFFRKGILLDVPLKHTVDLPAGRGRLNMLRMDPMVATKRVIF